MRRPENQTAVVGTLLGSVDGSEIEIQTCFPVPLTLDGGKLEIDGEYSQKMLNFHRKINRKEQLIGFYKTGNQVDETTFLMFYHYSRQLKAQKNKGVLPKPIILLIDPTMTNNKLSIKVLNFYSAPEVRKSIWTGDDDEENTRVENFQVFAELPY